MQTDPLDLKAEALRQLHEAVQRDRAAMGITPVEAWDELRSRIEQNDHRTRPSRDWDGCTE